MLEIRLLIVRTVIDKTILAFSGIGFMKRTTHQMASPLTDTTAVLRAGCKLLTASLTSVTRSSSVDSDSTSTVTKYLVIFFTSLSYYK